MLGIFLWAAQLHSTKNFLVTCVGISKCHTEYLCDENPVYNELNQQPNCFTCKVKAFFFFFGMDLKPVEFSRNAITMRAEDDLFLEELLFTILEKHITNGNKESAFE